MGDFKFEVWPTEYRHITQYFGVNRKNYAQFGLPGHDGIDIRAPTGSKVFCVAPGEVYRIHSKPTGHNYGIHVRVTHQDGYQTIYAHLQKVLVRTGQIVKAGELLGLADNTGNSFGSHMHLTLKQKGVTKDNWPYNIIDPTPFLLPLLGWQPPAGPYVEGWVVADAILINDNLAQVNEGGATLYVNASLNRQIPAGSIIIVLQRKDFFVRVRVPRATVRIADNSMTKPSPEPPPIVSTVDGWAWRHFLTIVGNQALVGSHGINLRTGPEKGATNIGMVKAGSTVSITGHSSGRYLPLRVRRSDFIEPVNLPNPPPDPKVLPPKTGYMGWALTQYLSPLGRNQALTSRLGANLRNQPGQKGQNIGLIKAFATVSIPGPARDDYSPVLARPEDILSAVEPMPSIEMPDPFPNGKPATTDPEPVYETIPGWSFTNGLTISANRAKVERFGSNLRAAPRRDGKKIGFIPPGTTIIVTGPPKGEYTPVRVSRTLLEPPTADEDDDNLDSQNLGRARIGLHASADAQITEAEHQEFAHLRPGAIKVLSMHGREDIGRLAKAHPNAHWIVRAYLDFGGRRLTPSQFFNDTISDVRRALDQLQDRHVVVELHNEPNISDEGLGGAWSDGATFELWWLELLKQYRRALPGVRIIYPGLSPGSTVTGVKQDHVQFLEASRTAVETADGLGVHIYWSNVFSMQQALSLLDDHISRFRDHPIWVTEASHQPDAIPPTQMAQEYLRFWRELQSRPVVQAVTYFVASASNPKFASQVWVGKGIGRLIGKR